MIKVAEGREVVEIVGEVTALAVQHFGRSIGDSDVFLIVRVRRQVGLSCLRLCLLAKPCVVGHRPTKWAKV